MESTELEALPARPAAIVKLRSSTAKDGGEGYDLEVTSEATKADVDNAVQLALEARKELRQELGL